MHAHHYINHLPGLILIPLLLLLVEIMGRSLGYSPLQLALQHTVGLLAPKHKPICCDDSNSEDKSKNA